MTDAGAQAPNREQIDFWNGPRGDFWVRVQEERDRELAAFGEQAMRVAHVAPGEAVVDVGCGCGATSLALADAVGSGGSVLGLDISEPMLARARERAVGYSQLRLEVADASQYPFVSEAALVFSRFGVMFFDDPRAAFANLRRALRTGGRLAFVCWRGLADNVWMRVPFEAVSEVVKPKLPPPPLDAPGPLAFADAARVRSVLEGAGFVQIALEPFDCPMPLGSNQGIDAAAAESLTVGPAARLLIDATQEDRERALEAVKAALRPHATGQTVELLGAAWIVTAEIGI